MKSMLGVGAVLLAALVAGCASLPAPESEQDTLLVVPVHRMGNNSSPSGSVQILIRGAGQERILVAGWRTGLRYVRGLAPATYELTARYRNTDAKFTGSESPPITAQVTAGAISVLELTLEVVADQTSSRRSRYMSRWRPMTSDEHAAVTASLESEDNYPLW